MIFWSVKLVSSVKRELNWNANCWKFAAFQLCELAEILSISVGGHCIKFLKYIRTSYHWFQKMAHIHWSAEHSICFMIRCSCSRINVHVLIQWYSSSLSTFPTSFHLLDQMYVCNNTSTSLCYISLFLGCRNIA